MARIRAQEGCRGSGSAISVIACLLAWSAIGPRVAYAQRSEAEQRFAEAERLLAAGQVAEACLAFEASNRLEPSAGTLINLGICREKLGQHASALAAFRLALERVKDPKKKQIASDRAVAIQMRVSQLTISVPAQSRLAGLTVHRDGQPVDAADFDRALPIDGGIHAIEVSAPGHLSWSKTIRVAAQGERTEVIVPRLAEVPDSASAPKPAAGSAAAAARSESDLESDAEPAGQGSPMLTTRRKLAIATGVAGLGAIAGGIALGLSVKRLEDEAFALCPDPGMPCADAPRASDALDRAHTRALLSNIAYVAGGGAVVGAAVLWLTGGAARGEPRIAVLLRPGGSGITVQGRF
jgi:hypothetical protein